MPYKIHISRDLVLTSLGRRQLLAQTEDLIWPFLSDFAALYRRTLLHSTRIVAVVGSMGKTTTARAVTVALGQTPHRRIGLNWKVWIGLALFRVRPGQGHAVMEVGIDGPGQMARYARIVRPDIAVVTAVGSEHNRSLGSLEVTRHEKAEMVRVLPASGLAVLNGDDPNVLWMRDQTRARVVTFGFGEENYIRGTNMKLDWPHGTRFALHTPAGSSQVRTRLIGRPMAYSILAAVAVALNEGFSLDRIISALETLEPTPGRLQPVHLPNGAVLLRDDFKSPEESTEAALDVLADIPARRRIVVLGEVAESVGSKHALYRRLGERVGQVASGAIFMAASNIRDYKVGAKRAGLSQESLLDARGSVRKAVEALESNLGPGDVVLIKGRGTQRLERIALALSGHRVGCELTYCNAWYNRCDRCPMLEKNWSGLWQPP